MPVEYTIIISVVSVACTVLGVSIGMTNMRRFQRQEDQADGANMARVTLHLDHIESGINGIKHDITSILLDTREQRERIIKVEESSKQAHKRIDELAGRRTG